MTKLWEYLDTQAQNLPVPKSHENSIVDIFCNDCFKVSENCIHVQNSSGVPIIIKYISDRKFHSQSQQQSTVKFHFIGLKCANCGGYNTTKNIKSRSFTFPSTKGEWNSGGPCFEEIVPNHTFSILFIYLFHFACVAQIIHQHPPDRQLCSIFHSKYKWIQQHQNVVSLELEKVLK